MINDLEKNGQVQVKSLKSKGTRKTPVTSRSSKEEVQGAGVGYWVQYEIVDLGCKGK